MAWEARQREENHSTTSPGLFCCGGGGGGGSLFSFFSFCGFHVVKIKVDFWYISGP